MTTATPTRETETVTAKPGDHDKFAHYVAKKDFDKAFLYGRPCKALCGKYWVPTGDFKHLPVCGTCKEVYGFMKKG